MQKYELSIRLSTIKWYVKVYKCTLMYTCFTSKSLCKRNCYLHIFFFCKASACEWPLLFAYKCCCNNALDTCHQFGTIWILIQKRCHSPLQDCFNFVFSFAFTIILAHYTWKLMYICVVYPSYGINLCGFLEKM